MFSRNILSWKSLVISLLLMLIGANPGYAQSSCEPDANGDFKPTTSVTCQSETGEFNYRDIVIPHAVFITYQRNAKNNPITIRANGTVTISGRLIVSGGSGNGRLGGKGGPGGFDGGRGGSTIDSLAGTAGDGPGGGAGGPVIASGYANGGGGSFARSGGTGASSSGAAGGAAGALYGTNTLLPLSGGSGGGGGSAASGGIAGGGGGGGGAILLHTTGTIRFVNQGDTLYGIHANGGQGGCYSGNASGGSGGSGGAIRLIADTIIGTPYLIVNGGNQPCGNRGQEGGEGYIRVEAPNLRDFIPNASPTIVTNGNRNPVELTNPPRLRIASIGGQVIAPTVMPNGSFYQQPDVTVPLSPDPVAVVVEGTNIPPATTSVQVTLTKESGERETKSCSLNTQSPRTCTVPFTLPTSGISVITASATLDVIIAFGGPLFLEGERINKVEIAASFGGPSQVTYITESGRRLRRPE